MPRKKRSPGNSSPPTDPAVLAAGDQPAGESVPFPVVAIGASAGGIEALTALLGALSPDTGMAFVVIQHLSPTHESMMSEILGRATSMQVAQVTDSMEVEPDHVYVIPPGKDLAMGGGRLHLAPRTEVRGAARPVDHFMRSLAEDHGHKSIAVVLSGTANDGSLGIQEIKAAGGITFAQDDTAEQTSMPRSAIATGAVDYVLAPRDIAAELVRIARHPYVQPNDDGSMPLHEASMQRILGMLRNHTGVDFDGYKRNTINRRVTRRILLHRLEGVPEYVRLLQQETTELEALFQDLLINVTSFFRNSDAYDALKAQVFPRLAEGRGSHDPIRIWVLGCSTGEEAYSLAMAFTEFAEASATRVAAQVFATDLNATAVEKARAGIYARGIAQDVSPERLRRFFVEVDGGYRIAKPIRDMCVFARQNVLADPPFSRLDVVACRNLLIYLDGAAQARMMSTLHYALRNHGFLWLGSSETIGGYRELFDLVDAKNKIYAKKPVKHPVAVPSPRRGEPRRAAGPAMTPASRERAGAESVRDADRLLLTRYSPPAVVVNQELEIIQFRGDTAPYLTPSPGRASLNLLKMLREGLLVAVRNALARARREEGLVRETGLRARSDGEWRDVDVEVFPLKARDNGDGAFVIVFEEPAANLRARARIQQAEAQADRDHWSREDQDGTRAKEVARLQEELSATRDYLQSVIEQQEAANEELQSANEEVQSSNEELQSINEELETSKEEIQSSNEELATVNDELQTRNLELSQSNNDLSNLLASVQLAIVMVGADLRIRRFTPAAEKLFGLIPGDIGRPLHDVKMGVVGAEIEEIVKEVIDTVSTREREVLDRNDRWHLLRVRPYRTLENRIEGAVVVMVDVDGLKLAQHALRESEARFEVLADSAPVLIWMNDLEGCRFVNRAFEDFIGEMESEIRETRLSRFVHPEDRAAFDEAYATATAERRVFEARARFRRSDGAYRWMKSIGTPRFHSDGSLVGYVGGTFDVTDLKEAEAALVELDRAKNEFLAVLAHELRNPLAGVRNAGALLAQSTAPAIVNQAREIIERQSGHMVRMIDDLLDVSRMAHGRLQLRIETLDIVALVRECIEATRAEREGLEQGLTAALPAVPIWVRGDALRLEQIVTNLLNNATRFTRRGGRIWVTVERDLGPRSEGLNVVLRVRDNGVGIELSLLPRIFDLFVHSDSGMEPARAGMGLGLTLAQRLVQLHGGTIEAVSAGPALGSEFVVRLPPGESPDEPDRRRALSAALEPREPRRILIIDDNVDSAESMRMLLRGEGHHVDAVNDGGSGLEAALRIKPDAILLDIGLPDMDGYTVARELRRHRDLDGTVVIATTGYGREEDQRKAREAGIDEHMTKPIDIERLMDLIVVGRVSTRT